MPLTTVSQGLLSTDAQYTGFKNRIINGAMVIDQRNAGASVTPADGQYTLDRWVAYRSQSSKYSVQQDAGAVTPPAGFIDYLGVTSLSAYSAISTDYFGIAQFIEGFNIADLGWGTASAQTVTISFWVRASLTGTYPVSFRNSAGNRGYLSTYTISAANTWEYKTITIPGDTTGTWLTNNGIGVRVWFDLGSGSDVTGTAGVWGSATPSRTSGSVSLVGTSGATWYITGAQLEKGSTATSFDYRPYGTELALCQRYCEVNAGFFGAYISYKMGGAVFAVPKRAVPTVTFYSGDGLTGSVGNATEANATGSPVPVTSYNATVSGITNVNITYGTTTNMSFSFIATSEL